MDNLTSLAALCERAADTWPGRPALTHNGVTRTYADLAARSWSMTAMLARNQVRPGDRVAIATSDVASAVTTLFGAVRLGAVAVLVNDAAPDYAIAHIVGDCRPAIAVCPAQSRLGLLARGLDCPIADPAAVRGAGPRVAGRAYGAGSRGPACIIYTSGSTGRPRGVVVSHENVLFATSAISSRLDIRQDDVIGCLLPPEFDYGLYQIFLAMAAGAHVAWASGGETGHGMLDFLAANRVTVLPAVPQLARGLCLLSRRRSRRLPPLRMITNTASPIGQGLLAELRAIYPAAGIYLMFGLTECKRVSILLPSELESRPASVGRPLDGTACTIVDEAAEPVTVGTTGELVVRGPHVALGYWGGEGARPVRFRTSPGTGECLLFTGDQCWMDADGYLYFAGRRDDIYKSRSYRVSAAEVALAAEDISGVAEACCLPPRDEGDEAVLFVVAGLTEQQIRRELTTRLESFRMPGRIVLADRLPRTRNGKIDRTALKAGHDAR
jgi:acyl-coenzyme A synthetase/AMP-(fatty) acid ligase